jgi:D-cysteine desulfhydrase family pyridoxal phosphate-dependent enzyme
MKPSQLLQRVTESLPIIDFSILPTPLSHLSNISTNLRINIFCKRDDLTGFGFGGNKTRKLDYIIKVAIDSGADSIVTFGSNQSNWCRMTSAAARACGLDVFLILAGGQPAKTTGNLILNELVGASIEYADTEEEEVLLKTCMEKMESLRLKGKRPFFIPVGGSTPIGCTGYIRAMKEIVEDEEQMSTKFSRIFVASGSAGTQAGLIAGKIISGWKGEIVGFSVSRGEMEHTAKVLSLTKDTLLHHNIEFDIESVAESVIVDDNYLGEGYRRRSEGCLEAIRLFASSEGIFLDEVYTGKAAAGVIDYARKGRFSNDENILFIHTGGNIQLFE